MKIDKIYVINLLRDNKHIMDKLNQLPIEGGCEFFILDAINGWKVASGEEKIGKFKVAD